MYIDKIAKLLSCETKRKNRFGESPFSRRYIACFLASKFVKNARVRLAISTPLGVWKSEEVLLLVFELLLQIVFGFTTSEISPFENVFHSKSRVTDAGIKVVAFPGGGCIKDNLCCNLSR